MNTATSSFGEVGTNTTFDSDRVALGRTLLDAMSQAQLYHGPVIMHLGRQSRPRMGMKAGLICLSVAHTALACDASLLSTLAPLRM